MVSSSIKPGATKLGLTIKEASAWSPSPSSAKRKRVSTPTSLKAQARAYRESKHAAPSSNFNPKYHHPDDPLMELFTDSIPDAFLRPGGVRYGIDDDEIYRRQLAVKQLREDGETFPSAAIDAVRAALKHGRAKHGEYTALVMLIDAETGEEKFVPAGTEESRQLAMKQLREDDKLSRSIRVHRHDAVRLALGRAGAKYGQYAALVHIFDAETGAEAFVPAGSPEAGSRKDDAHSKGEKSSASDKTPRHEGGTLGSPLTQHKA